jgi:hypothetical protein
MKAGRELELRSERKGCLARRRFESDCETPYRNAHSHDTPPGVLAASSSRFERDRRNPLVLIVRIDFSVFKAEVRACHQIASGAKSNYATSLLRHGSEGHSFSYVVKVASKEPAASAFGRVERICSPTCSARLKPGPSESCLIMRFARLSLQLKNSNLMMCPRPPICWRQQPWRTNSRNP